MNSKQATRAELSAATEMWRRQVREVDLSAERLKQAAQRMHRAEIAFIDARQGDNS